MIMINLSSTHTVNEELHVLWLISLRDPYSENKHETA